MTDQTSPRDTPVARTAVPADERFGGVKIGSAFFGWLVATGMTVLLTALLAAVGAGVLGAVDTEEVAGAITETDITLSEIGWGAVVTTLVIVFLAYYAGGYVAGRMARFHGPRQGAAVFGWSVVIALVTALLGLIAGAEFNVLDQLNTFPNIPAELSDLTTQGIVVLVGVLAVSLGGAMLGGAAGMRFHRQVDSGLRA